MFSSYSSSFSSFSFACRRLTRFFTMSYSRCWWWWCPYYLHCNRQHHDHCFDFCFRLPSLFPVPLREPLPFWIIIIFFCFSLLLCLLLLLVVVVTMGVPKLHFSISRYVAIPLQFLVLIYLSLLLKQSSVPRSKMLLISLLLLLMMMVNAAMMVVVILRIILFLFWFFLYQSALYHQCNKYLVNFIHWLFIIILVGSLLLSVELCYIVSISGPK